MTVKTVAGTGHTVFRDDHSGFMEMVHEWLRNPAPSILEPAKVLAPA
jgi:hypothetical protein